MQFGGITVVADEKRRWFLGFDPATKTLAFGLLGIAIEYYRQHRARLWAALDAARKGKLSPIELIALEVETKALIDIRDGEVTDLFPGRPDKSIHTVERIRGLAKYAEERITPSIAKNAGTRPLDIPTEFQMGPNAPARVIATGIITLFRDHNVYLIGPSLKNKCAIGADGRYFHFVKKYKTIYTANKEHSRYNFAELERLFGTKIPPTKPAKLRGHIADAVMGAIGYLQFGDENTNAF